MAATTEHPKVFISYSWTSPEHEQFVLELATALRSHGVDAILDKWDLRPGQDKYVFMESMVVDTDVGRVLVICDRKYQEKANAREGGVGTESQIISQELYGKVQQTKFIPVVCEYDVDGAPCLPVFMKGRIYVDLSSDERYGEGLDQLLRLIYEQPFHEKPKLGSAPSFVSDGGASSVKELRGTIRAIHEGKPNRRGLEALLVKSVFEELDKLYVQPTGNDYFEGVYAAITATKTLRDQLAEYADAASASSSDDTAALDSFLRLMELVAGKFGPPEGSGTFYPGWADLYGFFALESMLIQVAALVRYSRWKSLRRLLAATYVLRDSHELKAESFVAFDRHLVSLDEHRNQSLKLNRVSLSADLLKERARNQFAPFSEIMEADVMLALASVVRLGRTSEKPRWPSIWAPRTAIYAPYGNKFPLFMRAADESVRSGIHTALGVSGGKELTTLLNAASSEGNGFRFFEHRAPSHFDFLAAINAGELGR